MLRSFLAALFTSCAFLPLVSPLAVSTKYGMIEGLTASYPNASGPFKSVSKFVGVPFAAPPIRELRFKAPQPLKEWKPNVRQAKKHGDICLQFGQNAKLFEPLIKYFLPHPVYSEDCLYLNIYTPNVSLSLPVMVYIHGGGYEIGTSVTCPGDILALQGVVVVVIQYRLGPFGFLTTGDSAAPGNFGMLDQVEALKWVKENIENFGGNPSKVTIFGQSAGGTSVSLHLLSPLSESLFHQAIAESGVDLSPFSTHPVSFGVNHTKVLAEKLKCTTRDHSAMVTCIRQKNASEIKEADDSVNYAVVTDYLNWAPVVDNNFLCDTPRNLRAKKEFKKVNLMIVFNSQEAANSLPALAKLLGSMEDVNDGVSPLFFKAFITKLAHLRNSE